MYNPSEKETLEYKKLAVEIKNFVTKRINKLLIRFREGYFTEKNHCVVGLLSYFKKNK